LRKTLSVGKHCRWRRSTLWSTTSRSDARAILSNGTRLTMSWAASPPGNSSAASWAKAPACLQNPHAARDEGDGLGVGWRRLDKATKLVAESIDTDLEPTLLSSPTRLPFFSPLSESLFDMGSKQGLVTISTIGSKMTLSLSCGQSVCTTQLS
jgi:hypothetical protein